MNQNEMPAVDAPDFKWRLITRMVEEGKPPSRRLEDKLIRDGYCFMKRARNESTVEMYRLLHDYPIFYLARDLHMKPWSTRWMIEAGLLSDISTSDLAQYVGQPEGVVNTYAELFYNVRPRLNNRGYVLNEVLFPTIYRGMDGRDFDFLYKILAFCGGWQVLAEFIEAKEMDPKVESWINNSLNSRVRKLAWMAAYRIDINQYNAVELIGKGLELQALEREAGGTTAQQQGVEAMKALLQHCKMTIIADEPELPFIGSELQVEAQMKGVKQLTYGEKIPLKAEV